MDCNHVQSNGDFFMKEELMARNRAQKFQVVVIPSVYYSSISFLYVLLIEKWAHQDRNKRL